MLRPSEEKIPEGHWGPGGWFQDEIIARVLFVSDELFPQDAAEEGPDTGFHFSKEHEESLCRCQKLK